MDDFGHLLVTDYILGVGHSLTLDPALEPLAPTSMLGLGGGPCSVKSLGTCSCLSVPASPWAPWGT